MCPGRLNLLARPSDDVGVIGRTCRFLAALAAMGTVWLMAPAAHAVEVTIAPPPTAPSLDDALPSPPVTVPPVAVTVPPIAVTVPAVELPSVPVPQVGAPTVTIPGLTAPASVEPSAEVPTDVQPAAGGLGTPEAAPAVAGAASDQDVSTSDAAAGAVRAATAAATEPTAPLTLAAAARRATGSFVVPLVLIFAVGAYIVVRAALDRRDARLAQVQELDRWMQFR